MAISNNMGSTGPVAGPSPSDQKSFQNEIKDKSIGDLAKMAGDKNLPQWKQQEAVKELLKDLLKNDEAGMDDEEKSTLEDLLKALTNKGKGEKGGKSEKGGNAEGGELLAKLLQAMGVPGEVAQGIADALGGQGSKGDGNI